MSTQPEPLFMIDHMAIRLGKYLRIAGCDAVWDKSARTHELILRANIENRVFVTRNRRLPGHYPAPRRLLLLESTDPVEQLRQVAGEFGVDLRAALFTKCIRCNVALTAIPDKEQVRGRVHPNVFAQHEEFQTCPACGTVFWKGSHVRNTCRKMGLADAAP